MNEFSGLVFKHQYDSFPVPLYKEGEVKPERLFPDEWFEKFEQADEATQKKLVQSRFKTTLSDGTILKTIEGSLNASKRHPNYFSPKNKKLVTDMHKLAILVGLITESTSNQSEIIPDIASIPAMEPKKLTDQ